MVSLRAMSAPQTRGVRPVDHPAGAGCFERSASTVSSVAPTVAPKARSCSARAGPAVTWGSSHSLLDFDDLYARAACSANHVCRPAAVGKRHHQCRPPFVEHLLIADWTCRPAVLGPVGMKDHALDPPGLRPILR